MAVVLDIGDEVILNGRTYIVDAVHVSILNARITLVTPIEYVNIQARINADAREILETEQ